MTGKTVGGCVTIGEAQRQYQIALEHLRKVPDTEYDEMQEVEEELSQALDKLTYLWLENVV